MEETKYKIPFNVALNDPDGAGKQVLDELVERYPYAQSLRILKARQATEEDLKSPDSGIPLLYIGKPHRLAALLHRGGKRSEQEYGENEEDILLIDDVEPEDEGKPLGERPTEAIDDASRFSIGTGQESVQMFDIDDPEAEAADQILEAEGFGAKIDSQSAVDKMDGRLGVEESDLVESPDTVTREVFAIETVVPESHDDVPLTGGEQPKGASDSEMHEGIAADEGMDGLSEHPVSADYLAYEKHVEEEAFLLTDTLEEHEADAAEVDESSRANTAAVDNAAHEVRDDQQIVSASQARTHEKVSIYDDEHMPYSFLWWLNKARMEHASIYQPYISPKQKARAVDPLGGGDQALLDQQIRENVFHLQPPEEKLTAGNDGQTVSFKVPKESDPIIERFIREEPQIKPPNPDKLTLKNMAKHSAEDTQEIVTETLAKIYADQGHYNKAIDAYKKLSLKYPEKSSYFADRISELEKKFI